MSVEFFEESDAKEDLMQEDVTEPRVEIITAGFQIDSVFGNFIKKAAVMSLQLDTCKHENNVKLNSVIESSESISHIDYTHGLCLTLTGGSMHVIYQLIISIEKSILVPITYCDTLFKSVLDAYGRHVVQLHELEQDIRTIRTARTLNEMSRSCLMKALDFSEVLLDEYNILIMEKIGVPTFFPFNFKVIHSCSCCRKLSKPRIVSQHILKLEITSPVRSISISDLMRYLVNRILLVNIINIFNYESYFFNRSKCNGLISTLCSSCGNQLNRKIYFESLPYVLMVHVNRNDECQKAVVTEIFPELEIDMSCLLDSNSTPTSVVSCGLDGGTEFFTYGKLLFMINFQRSRG